MASSSTGKSRSAAAKGVVVWEWFNEHGHWRPYSPEVVAFIEREGQNTTQVCLANVSPALNMYTVDIPSMCQIRKGTGTSRPVRRVVYPSSSPAAQQVTWEYEGDQPGQWLAYDMQISACLEHAQRSQQQMLDMSSLFNLPYSVHFTTMQQVRINTGRTRKIRRSPLQTPYPPAAKSPRCYSKLTTILPDPTRAFPSTSQSQPQPSTSAQNGALPSYGCSATVAYAASGGSVLLKKRKSVPGSSSSDSDSDSDSASTGMTLRLRTRQYKRMKKSQGPSSCGKKLMKDMHRRSGSSASGPSGLSSLSSSGAGQAATTTSQATTTTTTAQSQQQNLLTPAVPTPSSLSAFPTPVVSLVSAGGGVGSTLPLNLLTYAQPLAANLSQGFPPMTHVPPSSHSQLAPPPSAHSLQSPLVAVSQNSSPAKGQVYAASSVPKQQHAHASSSSSSSHHVGQSVAASLGHASSSSSSSSSSMASASGQGVGVGIGAYGLLGPPQSSGSSWNLVPGSLPLHGGGGGMVGLSPQLSMMLPSPSSSQSLGSSVNPPTSQPALPPSSQGSGLAGYQGPLTRKRVLKQLGMVVRGGGGMLGGGGGLGHASSSSHPLMGGAPMSHAFMPQPLPIPAPSAASGLNPSLPHPQLQPPPQQQQQQLSVPHTPSQHLRQMHQHYQQQKQQMQQQQQQHLAGFGLAAPSGYPFNQSSFAPTLGHNILSGSALLIPGAAGSSQQLVSTGPPTVQGGSTLRQQPSSASLPVTETLPSETKIVLPKKKKSKAKPKTGEEVLARYMEIISPPENEDCCICYDTLSGPSSYGEGKAGQCDVIQLNKCSHMFHRLCLLAMYDSSHKGDSLQCPTCKTIYGELLGNCPPGEMSYDVLSRPLPGHPHCGTIRVTYYISPGVQGPEHPNQGRRFTARGFPRSGFLPDDNRGRKVLKLLMLAFRRKLMFTIGTSATTGECDTVTWNEIHHKTEFGSNLSGHGYPDPNYLDNVTAELALKGVTEDDL